MMNAHLPRKHPNIISYDDGWQENPTTYMLNDDTPMRVFFVTELHERHLDHLLEERQKIGVLSRLDMLSYLQQIITAVHFMHVNDISHKNISVRKN
jgi:serine/threonine protein kinase